jgi:hypothetical protein
MHGAHRRLYLFSLTACVAESPPVPPLDAPTLVAVIAVPAEARPGERVSYEAVVANTERDADAAQLRWSFCSTPRPLGENGPVAQACAKAPEAAPQHTSTRFSAVLPKDACAVFGSETPAGTRPNDADRTGGYYQPLRIALDSGGVAVFRQRIRCALANAPVAESQRYARDYGNNQAPAIARLFARVGGLERELDTLAPGSDAELVLTADPAARETYLRYDPAQGQLVSARERLTAQFWAEHAELDESAAELVDGVANVRVHGADGSPIRVWAVLSDDRGAASVESAWLGPAP